MSKAESSEVTYDFEINPSEKMVVTDLKEALSKAIKEAIQNVAKVDANGLKVSAFAVKVGFTIEKSTDIEGEYEILPVTPSLNRSWKRKAIHDIEISFE